MKITSWQDFGRIEAEYEAEYEAGYTRDSRGEDKGGVQTLCKHSSKTKYYANTLRTKILSKKTYTVRNPFTCLTRTWAASRPGADLFIYLLIYVFM